MTMNHVLLCSGRLQRFTGFNVPKFTWAILICYFVTLMYGIRSCFGFHGFHRLHKRLFFFCTNNFVLISVETVVISP